MYRVSPHDLVTDLYCTWSFSLFSVSCVSCTHWHHVWHLLVFFKVQAQDFLRIRVLIWKPEAWSWISQWEVWTEGQDKDDISAMILTVMLSPRVSHRCGLLRWKYNDPATFILQFMYVLFLSLEGTGTFVYPKELKK